MSLKIEPLEINDYGKQEINAFISQNSSFKSDPIVFGKNENSDLVSASKHSTQEFFGKVFDSCGPFWNTYSELGFATRPADSKYISFINCRMYFLKNIENKFMNNIGPEKSFNLESGVLREIVRPNIPNILLTISAPFDAIKQPARTIELGFLANESIKEFEDFSKKTKSYYDHYSIESNITDPVATAKESLDLAVQSMKYTNLALLSYTLKIRLKKSEYIDICESDKLNRLLEQKDMGAVRNLYGFYSLAPYDISKPRFREDISELEAYGFPEPPKNYALKWRENAKYLCARYLDIERIALKKLGEMTGLKDKIFYLYTKELEGLSTGNQQSIISLAEARKKYFEKCESVQLPSKIIIHKGETYGPQKPIQKQNNVVFATSVSVKKITTGFAVNINTFEDYAKCKKGSIIISKTLSPNLTILFKKAVGVVSENGGSLSHAAVIAREMDIPCLVQARFESEIKDGQYLQINGKTGEIKINDNDFDKKPENYKDYNEESQENQTSTNQKMKNQAYNEIAAGSYENKNEHEKDTKDIIWLNEESLDPSRTGSKAANLSILSKTFPVPPGFCITDRVFKKIVETKDIADAIKELKNIDPSDIKTIDTQSNKIKDKINNCAFPDGFETCLLDNIRMLKAGSLAVRSSSSHEDLKFASFAGQLDSYLDIKNTDDAKDAIRKCWSSFYNTRAIIYRIENNITETDTGMSVIVQQMINPAYSGVMFTKDPNNDENMLIEIVEGLCEDLVSGKVTPDSYNVNRENKSITAMKTTISIDSEIIKYLASTGMNIEKTFNRPQDIEWSIDQNSRLWILQSRPITT